MVSEDAGFEDSSLSTLNNWRCGDFAPKVWYELAKVEAPAQKVRLLASGPTVNPQSQSPQTTRVGMGICRYSVDLLLLQIGRVSRAPPRCAARRWAGRGAQQHTCMNTLFADDTVLKLNIKPDHIHANNVYAWIPSLCSTTSNTLKLKIE